MSNVQPWMLHSGEQGPEMVPVQLRVNPLWWANNDRRWTNTATQQGNLPSAEWKIWPPRRPLNPDSMRQLSQRWIPTLLLRLKLFKTRLQSRLQCTFWERNWLLNATQLWLMPQARLLLLSPWWFAGSPL